MGTLQAYDSRSKLSTDPIRNFKFAVVFHDHVKDAAETPGGLGQLGFMSVSGLAASVEAIPYREGGDNTVPRKLPGQGNFSDVTMTRGVVIGSSRNWNRLRHIFHAIQGRGDAYPNASPSQDFRWTVDIHVLDHPVNYPGMKHHPKVTVRLYNAWVNALAFSDLDAGGNAVLVEQMTVVHEGYDINWATGTGTSSPPPA